ncbi:hypothetical protein AB0H77_06620, partial [Streptomyces sp. NPDC050844]
RHKDSRRGHGTRTAGAGTARGQQAAGTARGQQAAGGAPQVSATAGNGGPLAPAEFGAPCSPAFQAAVSAWAIGLGQGTTLVRRPG